MRGLTKATIRRVISGYSKSTIEDSSLWPAAVMLLVFSKEGQYNIILNKRTDRVEHHKGEISFPGGGKDPADSSLLETALRETYEEMGILPTDIEVLGQLDDVATRTGFLINTFVGSIPYPYRFAVSNAEIAEVLEVPLLHLANPENAREEVRVVSGELEKTYTYAFQRHLIFGATAKILNQFIDLLSDSSGKEILGKIRV